MRVMATMGCVMLAACGQADAPGNAAPFDVAASAGATAQPASAPTPLPTAAAQDSGAKPAPATLRTFGDWTVGCDNGLTCQMSSLMPEDMFEGTVTAAITREAGEPGAIVVQVSPREDAAVPSAILIDGKRIAATSGDGRITGADAAEVARAVANGTTLDVMGKGGKIGSVSLKGASAALRYIDAAQGRAGTTSAIVARGAKPGAARAPAVPTIVAVAPGGEAAKPSAAQLAAMRKRAQCELPNGFIADPEVAALGGGKTLVLLPCSTGAYNLIGALFVIDGNTVTPADVDSPSGFEETGADPQTPVHSVVNGDFAKGVLTSYAKGRGLGDCGVSQDYVWDGRRFRLSKQSQMGECRGNIDYITTWRTNVVRR